MAHTHQFSNHDFREAGAGVMECSVAGGDPFGADPFNVDPFNIELPLDLFPDSTAVSRFFARLDAKEQPIVRFFARAGRRPLARRFASLVNRLGNGYLYVAALVALLAVEAGAALRPALAAGCSLLIAFGLYGWIKPRLARLRPCDADPDSDTRIAPLDKYSFPSGHCMTASAVALPLALSFPGMQLVVVAVGLVIAWSRMACGHHYLTDVLAGALLGIGVALPICAVIL